MPPRSRCIVCESTGLWGAALRWQDVPRSGSLLETRTLADARAALFANPSALLAVEVTPTNAVEVLQLLPRIPQLAPTATTVVLLTPELRPWELSFAEAGASLVVPSPRRLDRLARLFARHVGRQQLPAEMPWRERIWGRLPWSSDERVAGDTE